MSKIQCYCEVWIYNTEGPSPHLLNVFLMSEIDNALSYNPDICVWDLYTGWDEKAERRNTFQNRSEAVEYWYCTECKRIYELQHFGCGKILRAYKPVRDLPEKYSLDGFEELFVMWDIEMDDVIGRDRYYLLKDYIEEPRSVRYFISKDQTTVYGLNVSEKKLICKYILESGDMSQ